MGRSRTAQRGEPNRGAHYAPPPAISVRSLLSDRSDRAFQQLVFDLFTIAARMELVRSRLASMKGISGAQYSVLRAVALLQGAGGVSVGGVAEHLHVASTFITAQSRAMAQRGLLQKKQHAVDRRVALLCLTSRGERLVDQIVASVRPLNDVFFGSLERSDFEALTRIMEKLVLSSHEAMLRLSP
jgi:MarR family transcriptional regulator, organic hydroperoxide resistance regulator